MYFVCFISTLGLKLVGLDSLHINHVVEAGHEVVNAACRFVSPQTRDFFLVWS